MRTDHALDLSVPMTPAYSSKPRQRSSSQMDRVLFSFVSFSTWRRVSWSKAWLRRRSDSIPPVGCSNDPNYRVERDYETDETTRNET